jgi:hypothetical protein
MLDHPTLFCRDAADANDSGELDVSDAVFALLFLFAGGQPPPMRFSSCGLDATKDALDCVSFPPCEVEAPSLELSPEMGGTLQSADGAVTIEAPAGAVAEPVTISVRQLSPVEIPDDIEGGDVIAGAVWELLPDGLAFLQPFQVTYEARLEELASPEELQTGASPIPVLLLRSAGGELEQAGEAAVETDFEAGTVVSRGEIAHFSFLAAGLGPLDLLLEPAVAEAPTGAALPGTRVTVTNGATWSASDSAPAVSVPPFAIAVLLVPGSRPVQRIAPRAGGARGGHVLGFRCVRLGGRRDGGRGSEDLHQGCGA